MSVDLPAELDVWRAVAGRRRFSGTLRLSALTRLRSMLGAGHDCDGLVEYLVSFDRDPLAGDCVELSVQAVLPLQCQRTLENFALPVKFVQRLGLIRDEEQEQGLPGGFEPVLVPESGLVAVADLIEDELILAVPAIPVKPGGEAVEASFGPNQEERAQASPFAALSALKERR